MALTKWAKTRVAGWATRWEHPLKTQDALWSRLARGYHLMQDEQQFVQDVMSLRACYAKEIFQPKKAAL